MNYILHVNAFLEKAAGDACLSPRHYALYMVLFKAWNKTNFRNTFEIRRDIIMKDSKIASLATYYRCLKELESGRYIYFHQSVGKFKRASVTIIPYHDYTDHKDDNDENVRVQQLTPTEPKIDTVRVQPLTHYIQTNKTIINGVSNGCPSTEEVQEFFQENGESNEEALKFWFHFEATSWNVGYSRVTNWKALARKWMMGNKKKYQTPKFNVDDQDYYEPL